MVGVAIGPPTFREASASKFQPTPLGVAQDFQFEQTSPYEFGDGPNTYFMPSRQVTLVNLVLKDDPELIRRLSSGALRLYGILMQTGDTAAVYMEECFFINIGGYSMRSGSSTPYIDSTTFRFKEAMSIAPNHPMLRQMGDFERPIAGPLDGRSLSVPVNRPVQVGDMLTTQDLIIDESNVSSTATSFDLSPSVVVGDKVLINGEFVVVTAVGENDITTTPINPSPEPKEEDRPAPAKRRTVLDEPRQRLPRSVLVEDAEKVEAEARTVRRVAEIADEQEETQVREVRALETQ